MHLPNGRAARRPLAAMHLFPAMPVPGAARRKIENKDDS